MDIPNWNFEKYYQNIYIILKININKNLYIYSIKKNITMHKQIWNITKKKISK